MDEIVEYVPRFDKQLDVQKSDPHTTTLFVGGVGYGKTLILGDFVLEEMFNYPDGQMMVAGATIPAMKVATIFKLLENFKARNVWYEYTEYKQEVQFSNGSWFRFQSLDVPQKELEGSELSALAVDEITSCPMNGIRSLRSRVRKMSPVATNYEIQMMLNDGVCPEGIIKPGDLGWWDYSRRMLFCGNPPESGHWLEEAFLEREGTETKPWGRYVAASSYENKLLPRDYIESTLESQFPPGSLLHRRMMLGEFGVPAEGAIYDSFNPTIHMISETDVPWDKVEFFISGMDIGHSKTDAFATIFGLVTQDNCIIIFDEYYSAPKLLQQHSRSIRARYRGGNIWTDWSGGDILELRALGVKRLFPANKNIAMGIHAVNYRLRNGLLKFVRGRTPNLMRELPFYYWGDDNKPKKSKEGDHALDALRYLVAGVDLPKHKK